MKRAKETQQQTIIMASSASTHVVVTTTTQEQNDARKRGWWRFGGGSRCTRRRHTSSSSSSFVVFVRNEWDNDDDSTTLTTNAKTTTTTGSRRSSLLTMSPIQLQDVARKQFEDRERRRAQQVRRRSVAKGIRLSIFFQKSFLPPVLKKERVFIGGSFLRIILRLYFDATRFCLSPHTTPGGRPAARLSLGPFPTSESRENVVQ